MRLFLFEVLFVAALGISAYFISLYHKVGYEELKKDIYVAGEEGHDPQEGQWLLEMGESGSTEEVNPVAAEANQYALANQEGKLGQYKENERYRNILLVGVDARNQKDMTNGANTDVMILVNLDRETGNIRLVSILRDTLMRLTDGGKYYPDRLYDKANAQNCYTDISDTISMLNMNLDLDIREYVAVNWMAAAQIVDTLGGIEVTIDNEEILSYLNGYLTEVNDKTGIFSPQLTETGTQVLTGTQAVAFCRIRYAGLGDTGRTSNQRAVIEKTLEKMQQLVFEKPSAVLEAVSKTAESVVTNLTLKDLGTLALQAGGFTITDQCAFPFSYKAEKKITKELEQTKGIKDVLIADTLEENVIQLHQYLYGEEAADYKPSEYVRRISEDIAWMMGTE